VEVAADAFVDAPFRTVDRGHLLQSVQLDHAQHGRPSGVLRSANPRKKHGFHDQGMAAARAWCRLCPSL
jgi:hypothetical protein